MECRRLGQDCSWTYHACPSSGRACASVVVSLFGTVSPLQVVIERNPAAMRANGACIIAMPVVKALIQIQPNCPVPHTALPFPSQLRTVLLAWDAVRSAPWAFGIVTVYDEVFMYVDAFIGWIAATVTPK